MRKRYINCVCRRKTLSRSLTYHMRLPDSLCLSSLKTLSTPGAGAEKGWVEIREPISWQKASLLSSRYPPQNTSFLPARLGGYGGEKWRDSAFQEAANELASDQRFGASDVADGSQGSAVPRVAVPVLGGRRPCRDQILLAMDVKAARKALFCPA